MVKELANLKKLADQYGLDIGDLRSDVDELTHKSCSRFEMLLIAQWNCL